MVGASVALFVSGAAAATEAWTARPAADPSALSDFVDPFVAGDPAAVKRSQGFGAKSMPDSPPVRATSCDGKPTTRRAAVACEARGDRSEREHQVTSAAYLDPTDRYRHAVLGDAIEAGELFVADRTIGLDGASVILPKNEVFEDRFPRIADLDGDRLDDVVTIRSSASGGAAVTVYNMVGEEIVQRATTPFIGTPNRWLNIAGIADFLGDGSRQIAYVEKPHIGGTLYVLKLVGDALKYVGEMDGFSNHEIGSRELGLSAVADIDEDGDWELALPSFDRRALRIVGFEEGVLVEVGHAPLPGRVVTAIGALGDGEETRFIIGLDDGSVVEVGR